MKIAIVIGHTLIKQGALSKHFGMREWNFYREVSNFIKSNKHQIEVFEHSPKISGYTTRVKDTAKRINNFGADLVIEMHFNAFNGHASGCETLYYYNSKNGKMYAKKFSKLVSVSTGIKLRHQGLKALANRYDRGFASVYYPKAPAILIEPFFGDNVNDCSKIESPENLASIINEFLRNI